MSRTPRPIIYVRLSRADAEDKSKPLEVRFQERVAAARALAAQHGLIVPADEIYVEQESGAKFANRPGVQDILDRAHRRDITHIITPEQARLSRGDWGDQAKLFDALLKGRIVLITSEGVSDFADPEFSPVFFDFRALAARMELETFRRRMREANKARARTGVRSQGYAPYGYVWQRPTYANRKQVSEGR